MVFESATVFPTPEGAQLTSPPPSLDLRLPEAGVRVLREGRLGAVRAAVHDRPAVQLRRHRRAPGGPRHGGHVGQRQAGAEPRRPGPRAEGAQGPGPAAHPRRRARRSATTRTAATWPAASAWRSSRRTPSTRTSTSRRPRRRPCSSWPRRSGARSTATARRSATFSDAPFEHDVQLARARRPQGPRRARLRGDDHARRRCSTRSSRGSGTELEAGRL